MHFGLRYDLRNPPQWRQPWDKLYGNFLDQVEWADQNGFSKVNLSEHHFSEDGYLPSLFTVGAAIAARTKKITISLGLVLLPLKHPVQVAEDAAVLDVISGGRLELSVGAGYRRAEFEGYGIPMGQRPGRVEEAVEIIRRCLERDEFSFAGRYWNLKNVRVMPGPVQKPRPRIVMGGSSTAAARRAARIADSFNAPKESPMNDWRDEMIRLGKTPGPLEGTPRNFPGLPSNFLLISQDPKAAWKAVVPHALYESNSYAAWAQERGYSPYRPTTDSNDLLVSNTYGVLTPEEAVALGKRAEQAKPGDNWLTLHPMMGGMPFDLGQRGLELAVSDVMPHFR